MPRIQRSPPTTPNTEIQRVRSSPEISATQMDVEADFTNITARNKPSKRLCPDFSPDKPSSTESFENRIMNMLTNWKKEQDTLLKNLASDLVEVKQQNKEIKKINSEIEKSIEFINKDFETMKKSIEKMEQERLDQRAYILELEKKVNDLQLNFRSAAIEIRNVPSNDAETIGDLTSILLKTCNTIQVPLKTSDLRDIYRLPGKKELNRPIIAEFLTVPLKVKVLEASRDFNKNRVKVDKLNSAHIGISGDTKPIYVAEHLPSNLRKLFYEARKFATINEYKFCWFQNGRIFLRKKEGEKSTIIQSLSCLSKMPKKVETN